MRTVMLDHARAIQACARMLRLRARVELSDFRLLVQGRNRYLELLPWFGAVTDGAIDAFPEPDERAVGFLGWLPQWSWQPEAAGDKLAFKKLCIERGLATPPYWTPPDASTRDFIVKARRSCSGHAIRGPYRTFDPTSPGHRAGDGEYCERFLAGTMARAWYWRDKLVCLEMRRMPTVTGDGERSIGELAAERMRGSARMLPPASLEAIALYQGRPPDAALPSGEAVFVDFRYASVWVRAPLRNVRDKHAGTWIDRQLSEAGRALWSGPSEGALWTLDAVADEHAETAFLLDMNTRPVVHPEAYFAMLEGLFGPVEPAPHAPAGRGPGHPLAGPGAIQVAPGAAHLR